MKKRIVARIVPDWHKSTQWTPDEALEKTNLVSPTFCAAKFKQTTIHLQNGHTHSCHHPGTHKVPLSELAQTPSALHNTHKKMLMREQMQMGERPQECEYCWKVEDAGGISDRIYKTQAEWAGPYVKDLATQNAVTDHPPTYLEVSFGNVCNFKCAYCAPHISSKWMEEIKQHGPYPTSNSFNNLEEIELKDQMPIPNNHHNPYVDAFWDYFPQIAWSLHILRVTGGEPLLNKNTFKLLDWLIEHPQPHMTISINTNLNVPKNMLDKAISKLSILENRECVKSIEIHTSAEGGAAASEYVRFGMDYAEWKKNLKRTLLTLQKAQFNIMSTFNICSFGTYDEFLKDMADLQKISKSASWQAGFGEKYPRFAIDMPYLRNPKFLSMFVAKHPDFDSTWFSERLQHFVDTAIELNYSNIEVDRIKRLKQVFDADKGDHKAGKDFIAYVDEYDKRRDTNFKETFPELLELYEFFK